MTLSVELHDHVDLLGNTELSSSSRAK